MALYVFTVNGKRREVDVADPETPLLLVLRDRLGLTGTRFGCGMGVCGACTVLESGSSALSCQVPVSAAAGRRFTTIEGLSGDGNHPCQKAWLEEDVMQCGYCQAGQLMNASALLARNPSPSAQQIDSAMAGNICRCACYTRIRDAIHLAANGAANKTPPCA